jgi:hypothetical protein
MRASAVVSPINPVNHENVGTMPSTSQSEAVAAPEEYISSSCSVRLLSIGLDGLALGEPALDARLHLRVRMLLRDAYRIVIGIRRTHLARGGGSERVGRVCQHGATGSRLC